MKLSSLLALFVLACATSTLAHAKSDWQKFEEAERKGDYAKAAKLIPKIDISDKHPETLERFANVCEHVGQHEQALRYRERVLWDPGYSPWRNSSLWFINHKFDDVPTFNETVGFLTIQLKSFAEHAHRTKQVSTDPYIAAYVNHLAGDTPAAVAAFHKLKGISVPGSRYPSPIAFTLCETLLYPAFDAAVAKKDWTTATALAHAVDLQPNASRYIIPFIQACENAGDFEAAVRLRVSTVWLDPLFVPSNPARYTTEGNPELLKEAAILAHRHHIPSDIPLVAAYVRHLSGDTIGAIKEIETIANHRETKESTIALFLCGDLWLELNALPNALSWYHRATYKRLQDSGLQDSRFHRTLGMIRQIQVLLLLNKPGLADYEIQGLLNPPTGYTNSIWKYIETHPDLAAAWKANLTGIYEAKQSKPTGSLAGTPFEQPTDSRPFLRDDNIFDETNTLVPRHSSVAIYTAMAKADQLRMSEQERNLAQQEEQRRKGQAERDHPDMSNFVRSYTEARELAALPREAAPPPQSTNEPATTGRPLRRCSLCLGTGKANYVTGQKYEQLDSGNRSTGNLVDPPCRSCNGTGWR